jgi:hypothetical protein
MSIPLDRLYHYIESIARDVRKSNVVIYRFFPDGSKKQEDLKHLNDYNVEEEVLLPHIICHDQEPLMFDEYESAPGQLPETLLQRISSYQPDRSTELYKIYSQMTFDRHNLRYYPNNIYDHAILLHSELNSSEVERYSKNGFIPVHYWSHAVIAQDWFRYSKHIGQKKKVQQIFLIYNRAWSGTREYRLGFADRLIGLGLVDCVMMRVSPVDSTIDKHYNLHEFESPHWRPHNVIEDSFPLCKAESHYSADFDITDYESTNIEVVLETLFDDQRLHLTEKTLRPIAMGQPFILVGTHGSLKYLRDYGFKTFSDCWDESYDMITNGVDRMNKITNIMSDIVSMPPDKQKEMLVQAQTIAEYNKQHFFSDKFQNLVTAELRNNLAQALIDLESQNQGEVWLTRRKEIIASRDFRQFAIQHKKDNQLLRQLMVRWTKAARKYKLRRLSSP